jgi:hypothetical protein
LRVQIASDRDRYETIHYKMVRKLVQGTEVAEEEVRTTGGQGSQGERAFWHREQWHIQTGGDKALCELGKLSEAWDG